MADETLTPGDGQGAVTPQAPQFDPSVLQATIQSTLKETLGQMATEAQQRQAEAQRQQQLQQQPQNPMAEVLAPHLNPLQLQLQLAQDASLFYTNPANADAHAYQAEIERIANGWAQQGKPMPRSDIWTYLQGQPTYQQKLREKAVADYQASLQAAQQAQTVGVGSPARSYTPGSGQDPFTMPADELKKLLEGVAF